MTSDAGQQMIFWVIVQTWKAYLDFFQSWDIWKKWIEPKAWFAVWCQKGEGWGQDQEDEDPPSFLCDHR